MPTRNARSHPRCKPFDTELRHDALWLAWRIRVRETELPGLAPAERERRRLALVPELMKLAGEPWPDQVMLDLARQALDLRQIELGLALYQRVARSGGGRDPAWYANTAAIALGNGEYRAASRLYLLARSRSATAGEQRGYFLAALRALQGGDMVQEAIDTAERELGDLARDERTLLALVELARAANRIDLADKYVRALLRLSLLEQMRRAERAAPRKSVCGLTRETVTTPSAARAFLSHQTGTPQVFVPTLTASMSVFTGTPRWASSMP